MEVVLYDDLDLMSEEEARELDPDLTDEEIDMFIEDTKRDELDNFIEEFKWYLDRYTFIAAGTLGLWYGDVPCNTIVKNINDFDRLMQDADNIRIVDNKGHLQVEAHHHDGVNKFELRKLNDKGLAYYERNECELPIKTLHERLFTNNYSQLPHYLKHLQGC